MSRRQQVAYRSTVAQVKILPRNLGWQIFTDRVLGRVFFNSLGSKEVNMPDWISAIMAALGKGLVAVAALSRSWRRRMARSFWPRCRRSSLSWDSRRPGSPWAAGWQANAASHEVVDWYELDGDTEDRVADVMSCLLGSSPWRPVWPGGGTWHASSRRCCCPGTHSACCFRIAGGPTGRRLRSGKAVFEAAISVPPSFSRT